MIVDWELWIHVIENVEVHGLGVEGFGALVDAAMVVVGTRPASSARAPGQRLEMLLARLSIQVSTMMACYLRPRLRLHRKDLWLLCLQRRIQVTARLKPYHLMLH